MLPNKRHQRGDARRVHVVLLLDNEMCPGSTCRPRGAAMNRRTGSACASHKTHESHSQRAYGNYAALDPDSRSFSCGTCISDHPLLWLEAKKGHARDRWLRQCKCANCPLARAANACSRLRGALSWGPATCGSDDRLVSPVSSAEQKPVPHKECRMTVKNH